MKLQKEKSDNDTWNWLGNTTLTRTTQKNPVQILKKPPNTPNYWTMPSVTYATGYNSFLFLKYTPRYLYILFTSYVYSYSSTHHLCPRASGQQINLRKMCSTYPAPMTLVGEWFFPVLLRSSSPPMYTTIGYKTRKHLSNMCTKALVVVI